MKPIDYLNIDGECHDLDVLQSLSLATYRPTAITIEALNANAGDATAQRAPEECAKCIYDLLNPGRHAIMSVPYLGYFKNVLLAANGKLREHFTALWDHVHIKFWPPRTIRMLLTEAGFDVLRIRQVGRIPAIAKSMLVIEIKR